MTMSMTVAMRMAMAMAMPVIMPAPTGIVMRMRSMFTPAMIMPSVIMRIGACLGLERA